MEKKKCKNCHLFDKAEFQCRIQVMMEGERYQIDVKPNDFCHWEAAEADIEREMDEKIRTCPDPNVRSKLIEEKAIPMEVKHIRVYEENGQRKIEYN